MWRIANISLIMQTTWVVDIGKDPLDTTHEKTTKFGSQDKLDSDGVIKTNRTDLIVFLQKKWLFLFFTM